MCVTVIARQKVAFLGHIVDILGTMVHLDTI